MRHFRGKRGWSGSWYGWSGSWLPIGVIGHRGTRRRRGVCYSSSLAQCHVTGAARSTCTSTGTSTSTSTATSIIAGSGKGSATCLLKHNASLDCSREAHSCSREASLGAERRHALGTQEADSSLQHLGGKYEPLPPLFKYEPMPPPAFHHLLGKSEHECSDGGQTPLSGRIPPVTEKYSRLR